MKLLDTNVLLNRPQVLSKDDIIISVKVLKELDGLKRSPNKETAEKARRAAIYISRRMNELVFDLEERAIPTDDFLLELAQKKNYAIITDDVYLKIRAKAIGIETEGSGKEPIYDGISYFVVRNEQDQEALSGLYQGKNISIPSIQRQLKQNEYLIVDTNEQSDIFKRKGQFIERVKYTTIESQWCGIIKPRNLEQVCFFDALNDRAISILSAQGRYGSGY